MTSENKTSNVTTNIKIWRKSFGSDVRLYDERTKGVEDKGFSKSSHWKQMFYVLNLQNDLVDMTTFSRLSFVT